MRISLLKIAILLSTTIFWSINEIKSQNISINGTGAVADASAILDVSSPTLGMLVPRVSLTAINTAAPITSPTLSLLVFNTATASTGTNAVSPGYYYWDGIKWVRFAYTASGSSSTAWDLLGNAGTIPATNFLGTTDSQDLVFRTNNLEAVRINTLGYVGVGTSNPSQTRMEVFSSDINTRHNFRSIFSPTLSSNYSGSSLVTSFNRFVGTAGFDINVPAYGAVNRVDILAAQTGSLTYGIGSLSDVYHGGNNLISNAIGAKGGVYNTSTGPITNAYGVFSDIQNLSSGVITNGFGVYTGSVTGTNKWSFYASDATTANYFAGNVGIGTAIPLVKLQVEGSSSNLMNLVNTSSSINIPAWQNYIQFGDGSINAGYVGEGSSSGKLMSLVGHYAHGATIASYQSNLSTSENSRIDLLPGGNSSINFRTKATQRMIIDSIGNIGINTGSPTSRLSINNLNSSYSAIDVKAGWNTIGSINTGVDINMPINQVNQDNTAVKITANTDGDGKGIDISATSRGTTYGLKVLSSKNWGGAALFGTAFGVHSTATTDSPNGETYAGYFNNIATTGINAYGIYVNATTSSTTNVIPLSVAVNGTEKVRVNQAGNVGINTSTPTEKLEVAGSVKIVDGTQGAGKVLTSDAAGKASWNSVAAITPAVIGVTTNSLTTLGSTVNPVVYLNSYIDLPVGKWIINTGLLLNAPSVGFTPNSYYTARLAFSSSNSAMSVAGFSSIGSTLILNTFSTNNTLPNIYIGFCSGSIIVNVTVAQRLYLWSANSQLYTTVPECAQINLNSENYIYAIPIN